MNNIEYLSTINQLVKKLLAFISQVLYPRNDMNKVLLDQYKDLFTNYINTNNIDGLLRYRDIYHRASPEGAETDFTEGTSLPLNGEYTSLAELLDQLENLIQQEVV